MRVLLVLHVGNFESPIAWEYGTIARNLVEGEGYTWPGSRSWIPPVYPLLLAGVLAVGGKTPYLAVEIVQAALSALTALILYLLAFRLFGERAGLIALGLAALYPPLAVKAAYPDPITVEVLLAASAFLLLERFRAESTAFDGVMAGILLGALVLCRPVILVFVGFLSLLRYVLVRGSFRRWLLVLAALFVCLLPWTARNYTIHGRLVPVSTNGGYNFWIGNNPEAMGDAHAAAGRPVWLKMPKALKLRLSGLSEVERDRHLYGEGLRFIAEHPGRFLELTARRAFYFWWFRPRAGTGDLTYERAWVVGYKVTYGLLLLAGVSGLVLTRARWQELFPYYVLFGSLTLVYSVFFIHTRYRMLLEPFLMLFAAHSVCLLLSGRGCRETAGDGGSASEAVR